MIMYSLKAKANRNEGSSKRKLANRNLKENPQ